MNILGVIARTWRNRARLGDGVRQRELAAFLPAALEIQAAPPHPLTRWVARSLLLLSTVFLVWAYLGEVNIVASAEGRIVPGSRVKDIQPLERAMIRKIHVREGQMVERGQVLVELDSTLTEADERSLAEDLKVTRLQHAVGIALLQLLEMPPGEQLDLGFDRIDLAFDGQADASEVRLYKRLLWQQWRQISSRKTGLEAAVDKNLSERAMTEATIVKLEQTLPIITQRAADMRELVDKAFASNAEYLQLEQERIRQTQDLVAERHRLSRLDFARREIEQQIQALDAEGHVEQLAIIGETESRLIALEQELAKARDLNGKSTLYAPVAGQVKGLVIATERGVVTEAQKIMQIVPREDALEVEVFLDNKDIGFVREGMAAEIKVHTFPFTRYGVIEGEVMSISHDATADEQGRLRFGMRVRMARDWIVVNGRQVSLMPGMIVTAEVQTGHRRILEFFLAPLIKVADESIRER
jgi:hemolysin D